MSSSLNLSGSTAIVYISYSRDINLPASADSERGRETRRPAPRYPDLLGLAECGATTFEAVDREFADLTSPKRHEASLPSYLDVWVFHQNLEQFLELKAKPLT